jgi:hypothetical protein
MLRRYGEQLSPEMNENVEAPQQRLHPSECAPGDWIESKDVPDWPVDDPTHAWVLPGQVMVQPLQQMPAAVPLVSWKFRRDRLPGSGVESEVWIRES